MILALARGETVAAASRSSGFSRPTIYKRLTDPAILAEVRATRRRMMGATVGRLLRSSLPAAEVLADLLKASGEDGEMVRFRAAKATLELARDWLKLEDLEGRITALERAKAVSARRSNGRSASYAN